MFDVLSRLVDKSLVVVNDAPGGELRYRLLETLRTFHVVDRAHAAGDLTILRDAHAAWWTDWLEPELSDTDRRRCSTESRSSMTTSERRARRGAPPLRRSVFAFCARLATVWLELGRSGDAMRSPQSGF